MLETILYIGTLLGVLNPASISGNILLAKTNSYFNEAVVPVLASKSFSMDTRYGNEFVNGVFKDNMLLTLNYMNGTVKSKSDINWDKVITYGKFQFSLAPGESFAFHDQIKPEYSEKLVKTTNAHFSHDQGFRSDGRLFGDGVCHLASLLFWAAKDAGLTAISPTNHNFAKINEVPREYGVSIYYMPGNLELSASQNLYITNNLTDPVNFVFTFDDNRLLVEVTKGNV